MIKNINLHNVHSISMGRQYTVENKRDETKTMWIDILIVNEDNERFTLSCASKKSIEIEIASIYKK